MSLNEKVVEALESLGHQLLDHCDWGGFQNQGKRPSASLLGLGLLLLGLYIFLDDLVDLLLQVGDLGGGMVVRLKQSFVLVEVLVSVVLELISSDLADLVMHGLRH